MLTMISWEAQRAQEVAKWQQNIVLGGMPLMGEMEELSEFYGKSCWTWKGSNARQEKNER